MSDDGVGRFVSQHGARDSKGYYMAPSQLDLAEHLCASHPAFRDGVRFVPELDQFVVRDVAPMTAWDSTPEAQVRVVNMVIQRLRRLAAVMDHNMRRSSHDRLLSRRMLTDVVALLTQCEALRRPLDRWDENAHEMQTPACVVNLDWGTSRRTTIADFNLRRTAVEPDFTPQAAMPVAEAMLASGFAYAPDQLAYFWRSLGSSMFGSNPEQTVKWLIGESGVGKSTFLLGVAHCLGDYARVIPSPAFVRNAQAAKVSDAQDRYVLADLAQARFALVDEVPRHGRINAVLMKQIANNATVVIEEKFKPLRQAEVKAHVWITANHMPPMPTGDEGIERRMQVVEMNGKPGVNDDALRLKLAAEYPVLLARLIIEASRWSQFGKLPAPAASRMVVSALVSETKLIERWFEEAWEFTGDRAHRVHSRDLWTEFEGWWLKQDEARGRNTSPDPPVNDIDFYRKLRDRIVRQLGKGDESLWNDQMAIDGKRGAGYYGIRKRI